MEPEGCRPDISGEFRICTMITGLQPLDLSFAVPNLGLYPSLVLCAPLVLGRGGNREWTPMDANGDWEKGYPQMGEGVVGWALTDLPRQGSVPSLFLNDKKSEN